MLHQPPPKVAPIRPDGSPPAANENRRLFTRALSAAASADFSWVYRTAAIALLIALVTAVLSMRSFLLDNNQHVVLARRVYRSGQPSPSRLLRDIERLGLRCVINLHEGDRTIPLFARQRQVCAAAGIQCIGVNLPEDSLPSRGELLQLIRALDRAEQPVLLHGRYGIARSGLAAAVARLLVGQDPAAARSEFSWRHGCVDRTPHSNERVISAYQSWLAHEECGHCPATFRHWAQRHYEKSKLLLPQPVSQERGWPRPAAVGPVDTRRHRPYDHSFRQMPRMLAR